MYRLGIKELDDAIGDIEGGVNIMVIGPPMCGKEAIVNRMVMQGLKDGEGVVLLATNETAGKAIKRFSASGSPYIGVVDCISKNLGVNPVDTPNIKNASSPVDLTGISIRISDFMDEYCKRKSLPRIRLCINSLSTMLMYTNVQTLFQFIHVYSGRIMVNNGLGIYVVEEGMHDEKTVASLKQLFNAMIEVKNKDDRYYMRAVGLSQRPTMWYEFDVEGEMAVIRRREDDKDGHSGS
jgi:KaiC/GvpD/RAD55 family RecA-like ATPase